jgi:hypothetical protein
MLGGDENREQGNSVTHRKSENVAKTLFSKNFQGVRKPSFSTVSGENHAVWGTSMGGIP